MGGASKAGTLSSPSKAAGGGVVGSGTGATASRVGNAAALKVGGTAASPGKAAPPAAVASKGAATVPSVGAGGTRRK